MAAAGAPKPPPERQCTHIRRYPSGDPIGRCNNWAMTGGDLCYRHTGRGLITLPPDERRCTGTTKNRDRAGQRCGEWALKGQTVCAKHGGTSPQALKAAGRRIVETKMTEDANKLLVRLGAEPVDNPLTALAELAGELRAFKNALGQRVNQLEAIRYEDDRGGEQLRSEVALYERAVSQFGNMLASIAKLNIDERLAAITEKQAEKVMTAIDAALIAAGVQGDARTAAKQVAARHLRSVG